jgi:5-methyltetrahydrofolate corrinoid/iron sulfur protein methyltransferase
MVIVGELINASRKPVAAAIENREIAVIQKIAIDQAEAGADYIDVNAGIFVGKESEYLEWLTTSVQDSTHKPCALDSPDPKALMAAIKVHRGTPMINSISLEKERFDALIPVISGTGFKVVALCMSDAGMPETVDDRVKIADKLVNALNRNGIPVENIYLDTLVQPVSVKSSFGMEFVNAIEKITCAFPGIHTICGLSNISFGLPNRKYLNQTFMAMAIAKGLDGAIVNPLDKKMMNCIVAAEALAGRDAFCMKYLKAYRAGRFDS